MEKVLRSLLILLTVSEANFRTLHWMAAGDKFNDIHKDADHYREMMSDDIDTVAEMILRETNLLPTLKAISYNQHTIIDTNGQLIHFDKYCQYAKTIFDGLKKSVEDCLNEEEIKDDIRNVGIKATLEGMHDRYDLQARYLIKRKTA